MEKTNNTFGHTDVVPVSKGWSTDPFAATIKEDKLYGRGSCDMKGFIACVLAYAPILSNSNLDRDIHFSFTFDEETACIGAPILIKELKKKRNCKWYLYCWRANKYENHRLA